MRTGAAEKSSRQDSTKDDDQPARQIDKMACPESQAQDQCQGTVEEEMFGYRAHNFIREHRYEEVPLMCLLLRRDQNKALIADDQWCKRVSSQTSMIELRELKHARDAWPLSD